MSTLTLVVAVANLVLLGAMSGIFFTYSNSVVPGLDRIEPERAAEAMRNTNIAIINPRFLTALVGAPITAAGSGFLLLGLDEPPAAALFFVAAGIYVLGCLMVTGRVNVPLNNALENGAVTWAEFSPRWRRWNTVRTFSCTIAVVLCGIGVYVWGD